MGVADEDDLDLLLLCVVEEACELAGADHPGLVDPPRARGVDGRHDGLHRRGPGRHRDAEVEALRDVGSLGNTMFAMAHLNDEKVRILSEGPFRNEPPTSPHRDPLGGLELVLGEYHDNPDKPAYFD